MWRWRWDGGFLLGVFGGRGREEGGCLIEEVRGVDLEMRGFFFEGL